MTVIDTPAGRAAGPGEAAPACHVTVLADRCAGCQECLVRCPAGAITLDSASWVVTVADDACVGCRQCERTCPFSAITVTGPVLVTPRAEAITRHPENLASDTAETRQGLAGWDEALAEAARCLQCPDPTCVRGCPAHNDIPGFIAAVAGRDLTGAHDVLSRTTMLPDVCSRVCDQSVQCEGACSWSLAGAPPVAIGALERFVCDQAPVPPPSRARGEAGSAGDSLSVAVVGAGPAGAAAAWELARAGASVTIYDRDERPGGLMSWGIPDFTLPDAVAARPFGQLAAAGAELRAGVFVHPADLPGLLADYDAVLLAVGASAPLRLPVPGAELAGVTDATSFLQRAKAVLEGGDLEQVFHELSGTGPGGASVVVIGGGNTAMDVARSARRLGMTATCVEWLDPRFATVRADELAEARAEGVEVRFLTTLTELQGEGGRVRQAVLAQTRQNRASHRPVVRDGRPETVPADLVVMAMGYRVEKEFADSLPGTPVARVARGLPDRRWQASGLLRGVSRHARADAAAGAAPRSVGELALGREAGVTAAALPVAERLYLAGDVLTGPATVVEAMAQGKRAASAILASRPRRPGRPRPPLGRVLVCYESRTGTTERASRLIAAALSEMGAQATAAPLAEVGVAELAAADLIVVGSWVEGLVLAGVRPARPARSWMRALPRLAGKPAAVFCTYAISARGAVAEMSEALTSAGARVLAEAAIPRNAVEREALSFATGQLAAVCWPEMTPAGRF